MIKREIEEKFKKRNDTRKVLFITGARQVGKSTFIKSMQKNTQTYITLDDLNVRELAKKDPKLFLMNYQPPLIIDEVQYAPNIFSYIKMDVDENPEKGKYWLTGSQKLELMKNVSESLAGRVTILEMSSLSYAEKKGIKSKVFNPKKITYQLEITPTELFEEIYRGGMPEYINDKLDRNEFFNDYVTTYIERDVRNLTQVGDLISFKKFFSSSGSTKWRSVKL